MFRILIILLLLSGLNTCTRKIIEKKTADINPAVSAASDASIREIITAPPETAVKKMPVSEEIVESPRYRLRILDELTKDEKERKLILDLDDSNRGEEMKKIFTSMNREKAAELLRIAMIYIKPNIRIQAALILLYTGDKSKETIEAYTSALRLDPDADVRSQVARVLVNFKHSDTIPALIEALEKDSNEMVRANSAWALGSIGDSKAVEPLRKALKDPETWVRLRTVSAFKKMKPKSVLKDIIECLDDKNDMVRDRTLETLKEITGKNFGKDSGSWKKGMGIK
jgi:HEAT repeat protein